MYGHLHSLQDPHKVVLNTRSESQFTVNIYSLNPYLKAIITKHCHVSMLLCGQADSKGLFRDYFL